MTPTEPYPPVDLAPVEAPIVLPVWAREPVRRTLAVVAAIIAFLGAVLGTLTAATGFVPEKYRTKLTIAIGGATIAVALLTRLSAEVARRFTFSAAAVGRDPKTYGPIR